MPSNEAIAIADDDWVALALTEGVGPARYGRLLRDEAEPGERRRWLAMARAQNPLRQVRALQSAWRRSGICSITPNHDDYPPLLRTLADPPAVLFAMGETALLQRPQVAVIGTRRMSRRGEDDVAWLVAGLVASDLVVTSGLALGIDTQAHRQALAAGGSTIAVLGGGLRHIGPRRNLALAERIAADGLLVSEQPPDVTPEPWHFPVRNRLISGLSLGVVVVEAAARSGSLITARLAAEQGREVFALPTAARDPGGAGCHRLLRDGAKLVTAIEDVLEELPLHVRLQLRPVPGQSAAASLDSADPVVLSPDLVQVLDQIAFEPVEFDTLLLRTRLDAATLNTRLLSLELEGRVFREGARWVRCGGPAT